MAWASTDTFPSTSTFPGFDDEEPPVVRPSYDHELLITVKGGQVDISADIQGEVELEYQRRTTEIETPQAGTIAFTLDNGSGRYTPDNPGSPYYPDLRIDTPVEYWVTSPAGLRMRLFKGRLDGLTPDFGESQETGIVSCTGADPLAQAEQQTMKSDVVERWNSLARGIVSGTTDAWMFAEQDGATQFANTGQGGMGLPAVVVPSSTRKGQVNREEPESLNLEGGVKVTDSGGRGPVILARHAAGQRSLMLWFKFDQAAPYLPEYSMLASGRRGRAGGDADGGLIWSLRYAESAPGSNVFQLEVRDASNALAGVLDTKPADGAWHSLFIWQIEFNKIGFLYDDSSTYAEIADILLQQEYVVLGGQMSPYVRRGQQRCMTASFAGLMVSRAYFGGLEDYAREGTVQTSSERWDDLMDWRTYGAGTAIIGSDVRDVAIRSTMGRSQLTCIAELATTIGGTVWHNPQADAVEMLTGPQYRPIGPAASVVLWQDDDISAGHEWGLSAGDCPTRATATCPAGEALFVDEAAEAGGTIRDAGTIETCASDVEAARHIAAWQVGRVRRLALSTFGVDLTSAVHAEAMWPQLLGMRPGARLRVLDLVQGTFGISQTDVHVVSWKITIGLTRAQWQFMTLPADSPAEFAVGHATHGRIGWEPGDAQASALTPGSTTVTITAPQWPLTTAADDYPLPILIDGEQMTITSPPASAVSPQKVTIKRGAGGTLAVRHAAGADVLIWPDVRVGP